MFSTQVMGARSAWAYTFLPLTWQRRFQASRAQRQSSARPPRAGFPHSPNKLSELWRNSRSACFGRLTQCAPVVMESLSLPGCSGPRPSPILNLPLTIRRKSWCSYTEGHEVIFACVCYSLRGIGWYQRHIISLQLDRLVITYLHLASSLQYHISLRCILQIVQHCSFSGFHDGMHNRTIIVSINIEHFDDSTVLRRIKTGFLVISINMIHLLTPVLVATSMSDYVSLQVYACESDH